MCVLAHLPRGHYRRFLGPLGTMWPPTSALVALDVAVGASASVADVAVTVGVATLSLLAFGRVQLSKVAICLVL